MATTYEKHQEYLRSNPQPEQRKAVQGAIYQATSKPLFEKEVERLTKVIAAEMERCPHCDTTDFCDTCPDCDQCDNCIDFCGECLMCLNCCTCNQEAELDD